MFVVTLNPGNCYNALSVFGNTAFDYTFLQYYGTLLPLVLSNLYRVIFFFKLWIFCWMFLASICLIGWLRWMPFWILTGTPLFILLWERVPNWLLRNVGIIELTWLRACGNWLIDCVSLKFNFGIFSRSVFIKLLFSYYCDPILCVDVTCDYG